jgi:hypothetical protein
MTTETTEVVRTWAAEWADRFDQDWSVEKLESFGGKKVKAEKPATEDEGPRGFEGTVVGYSIDKLVYPLEDDGTETTSVYRYSFILATGAQVAILSEMVVEEVSE